MIPVSNPDLSWQHLELPASSSRFREAGGVRLVDRVQFGGPVAVPLGVDDVDDDPDLAIFIAKEADVVRYSLIHAGVTFKSGENDTEIASAAVHMTLTSGKEAPIAWSLSPVSVSTPYEAPSSWSLGPHVKLLGADISMGTVEHGKVQHGEDVFLRAAGLMTSEPAWEFNRTRTTGLSGSYRLVLVVRAPTALPASLAVTISVAVKAKGLLRRFQQAVNLDGTDDVQATLTF